MHGMHTHVFRHCVHQSPQEGYSALNAYAAARGWKLYKIKPKLHTQQEIMWLDAIWLLPSSFSVCVSDLNCPGCSWRTKLKMEQHSFWMPTVSWISCFQVFWRCYCNKSDMNALLRPVFSTWQDEDFIGRVFGLQSYMHACARHWLHLTCMSGSCYVDVGAYMLRWFMDLACTAKCINLGVQSDKTLSCIRHCS